MSCSVLGYDRQSYYKRCRYESKEISKKEKILSLVCKVRKKLPSVGTRKLYKLISEELVLNGIKCGRDQLFTYMKEFNLLVKPKKRYVQTTFSKHWMRKYPNIFKDYIVTGPEQVWVSDITYLRTNNGNSYLTLITDAYSRKIVGYNVSKSMGADECVKALKMAIKSRLYPGNKIIHHSDRGLQYCSKEYVETAQKANIMMSMTETSSPYDNALAERMNRTMKEEFNLYFILKDNDQANKVLDESIELYNYYRPHLSLDFFTPGDIHKNPQLRRAIGV